MTRERSPWQNSRRPRRATSTEPVAPAPLTEEKSWGDLIREEQSRRSEGAAAGIPESIPFTSETPIAASVSLPELEPPTTPTGQILPEGMSWGEKIKLEQAEKRKRKKAANEATVDKPKEKPWWIVEDTVQEDISETESAMEEQVEDSTAGIPKPAPVIITDDFDWFFESPKTRKQYAPKRLQGRYKDLAADMERIYTDLHEPAVVINESRQRTRTLSPIVDVEGREQQRRYDRLLEGYRVGREKRKAAERFVPEEDIIDPERFMFIRETIEELRKNFRLYNSDALILLFEYTSVEDALFGLPVLEKALTTDEYANEAAHILAQLVQLSILREAGIQVIHDNFATICERFIKNKSIGALEAISMIALLGGEKAEEGKEALIENISRIKECALGKGIKSFKPEYLRALADGLSLDASEQPELVSAAIEDVISRKGYGEAAKIDIAAELLRSENSLVVAQSTQYIQEIVRNYNLPYDRLMQAWIDVEDGDLPGNVKRNLHAIRRTEELSPGSTAILEAEPFTIRTFDRYPPTLLAKQVREIDDTETPSGTVILTRWDHIGAYYTYKDIFTTLSRQLDGKFNLKFIEIGFKKEGIRNLSQIVSTYGKQHFALLPGHSNGENIGLGPRRRKQEYIFTSDLRNRRALQLRDLFVPNPTIILPACSSWGGIAVAFAEVFGSNVIAPQEIQGINSINVKIKNGEPVFDVEFVSREESIEQINEHTGRRMY